MNILELLQTIAEDFDNCKIDYCVIGGQSLRLYNYIRATNDIDILVSKESFYRIGECLIGRGYILRPGSNKNMYVMLNNGRYPIDVLVEGDIEGDFILPSPKGIRSRYEKIWWINLPKLIEFKLQAGRKQDLADVHNLIVENDLPLNYLDSLDYKYIWNDMI